MFCFTARRHLIPYLEGMLGRKRTEAVARHVIRCERCGDELELIRAASTAFRSAKTPAQEPAANLWPRIEREIAAAAPVSLRWRVRGVELAGAAAAAALILFAMVNVNRPGQLAAPGHEPSAIAVKPPAGHVGPERVASAVPGGTAKSGTSRMATSVKMSALRESGVPPTAPPRLPRVSLPRGRSAEPRKAVSVNFTGSAVSPGAAAIPHDERARLAGVGVPSVPPTATATIAEGTVRAHVEGTGALADRKPSEAAAVSASARKPDEEVSEHALGARAAVAHAGAVVEEDKAKDEVATGPPAGGAAGGYYWTSDRASAVASGAVRIADGTPTTVDLLNSADASARDAALFRYP